MIKTSYICKIIIFTLALFISAFSSLYAMHHECDIIIKNKSFHSGNLKKQAGEKCIFVLEAGIKHKLRICNQDKLPMEFESHDLRREKVIKANKSALISIPKLKSGKTYKFFEEFYGSQCIFEAK